MNKQRPRRKRRGDAYPMDAAWVSRQALHYVERFEATETGVRRVLERRIRRRCARTGEDSDAPLAEIDAVIRKLVELDYVDDRRFAGNLERRLRELGHSRARIVARLREKGVPTPIIDACVERSTPDDDLAAAWRLARKRRLGPFRTEPLPTDPAQRMRERRRQMGVLGRRGFSFDVVRQVLDATERPDVE